METRFYTNVYRENSKIYLRGYDGNSRIKQKIKYEPYVFRQKEGGFYRTVDGIEVDKVMFPSLREADNYVHTYGESDNVNLYGLTNWPYLFIYDNYPGEIKYDPDKPVIASIDIECAADEGFPDVREANKEITAITIRCKGRSIAFGCGNYIPTDDSISYIKCTDEIELLEKFLDIWNQLAPDIVTGWNIDYFDIPYLVNRIARLMGGAYLRLSPWQVVNQKMIKSKVTDKEIQTFKLIGISILDYYHLYRKFTFGNSESYKLGYIAQIELDEKKIDYSEYGSLLNLYKKDFQKFIEYNIHDAVLVEKLEAKLNFIKQVMAIAYDAKVNYNDTLTTVRPWDIIIHNYLLDRRIVVPQAHNTHKMKQNVGGYVKEPRLGWSQWIVSYDLKSSYPHNIMQYNISPDTMVDMTDIPDIDTLITKRPQLNTGQYAMAANGCRFRKDKIGFLAALMERMYEDRDKAVKQLAIVEEEYEQTKDPALVAEISRLHNYQMAKKIQLNSVYGALANQYFRWFDINLAEAITSSGQLAVRWVLHDVNLYLNKFFRSKDKDYIIASDTDSIYIDLEELSKRAPTKDIAKLTSIVDKFCKEKLDAVIDNSFDALYVYIGAYKNCMKMTRETIADKGIWTAKKHYILNVYDKKGVRYKQPKVKVTGIESVRSSTPQICRHKINEALAIIMNKNEETLQAFIAAFKDEFLKLPFEDVAFPRGIQGLDKYSDAATVYKTGTPIQVKGSLIFNMLLKKHRLDTIFPVQNGDKVRFAYLVEPNPIRQSVIAAPDFLPKEFKLEQYIDREKQFDKAFVEPLRTITGVIHWRLEHEATLESYFQ